MAGNYPTIAIDKNRISPAKLLMDAAIWATWASE
jgi:hypothetical protein